MPVGDVHVSEFFSSPYASPAAAEPARSDGRVREPVASHGRRNLGASAERVLGFFHLAVGLWLTYLTWATVLNIASGYHLPL